MEVGAEGGVTGGQVVAVAEAVFEDTLGIRKIGIRIGKAGPWPGGVERLRSINNFLPNSCMGVNWDSGVLKLNTSGETT